MDQREHQAALNQRALDAWGEKSQLNLVIEESAELIQALSKWQRKGFGAVPDSLIEELADVEIMLDQLKNICMRHDPSTAERFDAVTKFKLERLVERLETWGDKHQ
jgi:NTP pyrophosphatase (non-canonical NTP hydrolase)